MKRKARDINVTPLIDVLLVLLVIFMITAPMMVREILVDLPQVVSITKSKNVIKYDNIITISVDKNKNIFYNSKLIQLDEFIDKLSKESKNSAIAVEASKLLTYQIVYSLLIKIQDAGFYNVSLTGFY